MFEVEKKKIIEAGIKLDHYGLIALSGGNISWRMENGKILVTPSAMIYEDMIPSDICVVDINGKILEGSRRISVDTEAILHILRNRNDIHAVIHTHQPYATALGLVDDEISCNLTTLANATGGSVHVAEYSSAASIDMGVKALKHLDEQLAVVLKHHGVITIGRDLKQALYVCVYLEEACKTIILARTTGKKMAMMSEKQIHTAVEIFKQYGQ
ncbi:MAG: class II aldolase/adducin family protein [Breznakia sp.]